MQEFKEMIGNIGKSRRLENQRRKELGLPPKKNYTLGIIVFALLALWIIGIIKGPSEPKKIDSIVTSVSDPKPTMSSEPVLPIQKTSDWNYYDLDDKMSGNKAYYAAIESPENLDLKDPYSGKTTATLTIRKREGANNAYFEISQGQLIDANITGGRIRIKFDDKKPESFEVSGAKDLSSNILFINSPGVLISKLKKAKKIIIEVSIYDNGIHNVEFNTSGFVWNH